MELLSDISESLDDLSPTFAKERARERPLLGSSCDAKDPLRLRGFIWNTVLRTSPANKDSPKSPSPWTPTQKYWAIVRKLPVSPKLLRQPLVSRVQSTREPENQSLQAGLPRYQYCVIVDVYRQSRYRLSCYSWIEYWVKVSVFAENAETCGSFSVQDFFAAASSQAAHSRVSVSGALQKERHRRPQRRRHHHAHWGRKGRQSTR